MHSRNIKLHPKTPSNLNNPPFASRRNPFRYNPQTRPKREGKQRTQTRPRKFSSHIENSLVPAQCLLLSPRLSGLSVSRSFGIFARTPPHGKHIRTHIHTQCLVLPIFGTYIFCWRGPGVRSDRNEGRHSV